MSKLRVALSKQTSCYFNSILWPISFWRLWLLFWVFFGNCTCYSNIAHHRSPVFDHCYSDIAHHRSSVFDHCYSEMRAMWLTDSWGQIAGHCIPDICVLFRVCKAPKTGSKVDISPIFCPAVVVRPCSEGKGGRGTRRGAQEMHSIRKKATCL